MLIINYNKAKKIIQRLTLLIILNLPHMTKVKFTSRKNSKFEKTVADTTTDRLAIESTTMVNTLAIAGIDITLDEIRDIEQRSYRVIEKLRETVFEPGKQKRLKIAFSISEAARMIGRTPTAIRDAEK